MIIDILRGVELFEGLSDTDLEQVAALCQERQLSRGELLVKEGDLGEELFIITNGFVEVLLETPRRVVVNLGTGQLTGEMALVDGGPRSASLRAISDPTIVQVINKSDFETLCDNNTRLGYVVYRNIAADLSFKLRHRNLSEGMG
jgi:CRP/FNR family cyclic AMP-dependent transcriptional regulator